MKKAGLILLVMVLSFSSLISCSDSDYSYNYGNYNYDDVDDLLDSLDFENSSTLNDGNDTDRSNYSPKTYSEHEHSYALPTCFSAAYCTICGETYGEPLTHFADTNGFCMNCSMYVGTGSTGSTGNTIDFGTITPSTSSTPSTSFCTHCSGLGTCGQCYGDGVVTNSFTGELMKCTSCIANPGRCSWCRQ